MLSVEVLLVFFSSFQTSSPWMPSFSENWHKISGTKVPSTWCKEHDLSPLVSSSLWLSPPKSIISIVTFDTLDPQSTLLLSSPLDLQYLLPIFLLTTGIIVLVLKPCLDKSDGGFHWSIDNLNQTIYAYPSSHCQIEVAIFNNFLLQDFHNWCKVRHRVMWGRYNGTHPPPHHLHCQCYYAELELYHGHFLSEHCLVVNDL